MKSVNDFLDELKEKTGSDYKTSKLMNVNRAVVSAMRTRNAMNEKNAVKIAKLLGEPEEKLLLVAALCRTNGEVKEAWERLSEKTQYFSVYCFMVQALTEVKYVSECILCKIEFYRKDTRSKSRLQFKI